jgi:adenylate kinase family enzyme
MSEKRLAAILDASTLSLSRSRAKLRRFRGSFITANFALHSVAAQSTLGFRRNSITRSNCGTGIKLQLLPHTFREALNFKLFIMRCVIVGTCGAGKTAFARELAAKLGAPHIELDELHWSENWTIQPREEFEAAVRRASSGSTWVADGNYSLVRHALWSRATHIVWLNYSRWIVFPRVIRRTVRRTFTQEQLWHGNRESFRKAFLSRESVLLWSFETYSKNLLKYRGLKGSNDYSHLQWSELTHPAQATDFIHSHTGV